MAIVPGVDPDTYRLPAAVEAALALAAPVAAKVDKDSNVISALDHGVGQGNTASANTTALNALHTTAASSGATILLPAGSYSANALTVKVPMIGSGREGTTLTCGQITVAASRCRIQGMKIISTAQTAVIAANVDDFVMRDVIVDYDASVAMNWLALDPYNVKRLRVQDCHFRIGGLQPSKCADFVITGNTWDCEYLNTNEPCHISGQSSGIFSSNNIYRTATDGVDLFSAGHYCVISGNRFVGLRGGCAIECKVSMSDDPGNSSAPGNVIEGTLITNNVVRDFTPPATGTRAGIYAEWVDSRAVPVFAQSDTNRGLIIANNVVEDANVADPGGGIVGHYWGIVFTGTNGLVANNVVRNFRAWNSANPVGIKLAQPTDSKCVGVRVTGNIIAGIENGAGIEAGALDRCAIEGNTVRPDETSGLSPRWCVRFVTGSAISDTSISGNTLETSHATGKAIESLASTTVLTRCRVENNTIKNCGVNIGPIHGSVVSGNVMDSGSNNQIFNLGISGTSSRLVTFANNHITMASEYALGVIDVDGFTISGNTFRQTKRAILIQGGTRNGIVRDNISLTQTVGQELPHYSGVSDADRASVFESTNMVL